MNTENDIFLSRIKSNIPEDWTMSIEQDKLIFERKGDIWVKIGNKINSQLTENTTESEIESIKKEGRKEKCRISYRIEKRNPIDYYLNKIRDNINIYNAIRKLASKHKINKLIDPHLSTKGNPFFIPNTEKDKINLELYYRSKLELEKGLNVFPNFYSQFYTFYFNEAIGSIDEFHYVYPEKASEELFSILKIIKNNLAVLYYDRMLEISKFNNRTIFLTGETSEASAIVPENKNSLYPNFSLLNLKNQKLILLSKSPVELNKKIELIGKVICSENNTGNKYQIISEFWNYPE
jgi:hypothetical protein